MHDQKTWKQMEMIEQVTGKQIVRIETDDIDEMEEVCCVSIVLLSAHLYFPLPSTLQKMKKALK